MRSVYIRWLEWAFRTMPALMSTSNHEFDPRFVMLRRRLFRSPAYNSTVVEEVTSEVTGRDPQEAET